MKRSFQCLFCATVFVLLSAVKLISPAMASDWKAALIPVLDQNDDYELLLKQINQLFVPPQHKAAGELQLPEPPLKRIQAVLDISREDPMEALPKVTAKPETDIVETETDPALQYGNQVKDAFLQKQAEVTDSAPPEDVSYEVVALPFSVINPVDGYSSSGFGYRIHPILNELRFHYGTDFAADEGTEICSFADGVVVVAGEENGYGNYVIIDHGNGFETLYGHCSALLVSEGEQVSKGSCIALVGSTGQVTGPHLHFEFMHNGVYLNPEFYLYA